MRLSPLLLAAAAALSAGCTDYEYSELTVVDLFQQGGVGQVSDILYVVDDSASMAEERGRLLDNFDAFTEVLEDTRVDFQLGVVTTDATRGAGLVALLDDDTDDLAANFLAAIDVGDDGGRIEQGLSQALSAINPSVNPGFLRMGAELHVVVVSDEDDQSPQTPEFYTHEIQALTGVDRATIHGIVGDLPAGCVAGSTAASPGPRYLEAIETTGGLSTSICAADYREMLRRVGLEVANWNDTFLLSRLPVPDTIEVHVDDVAIPQRDEDGWTWSAGDNAIRFHGRSIPRPGMEIRVDYVPDQGEQLDTGTHDTGIRDTSIHDTGIHDTGAGAG
ncbi:MAG: VWA domain-containing protein [Deltaproteobacteria bacterium]|nr:MAG: VWA domain-containing protein [Deltaproteobacteria bacterium]